jgi:DNA repair exonuclease SbcCD ATPase subunit
MVSDHFEDRNARFAAILDRSAELTQRTEELLAEPRPVMTYEPPQPTRYRGYQIETVDEMIKGVEARLNKRLDAIEARLSVRMDALEGRVQSMWDEMGGLADEAGNASREVREEIGAVRKETEALRGDMALLRAQAQAKAAQSQRRKPTISRAPWASNEDVSFTN